MDILYWYFIFLLLLIILILLLAALGLFKSPVQPPINAYELSHMNDPTFNWGPTNTSGQCNLYTYKSSPIVPGISQPTPNNLVVSQIVPNVPPLNSNNCLDQDQLYLEPASRTCIGPGNTCIGFDGTVYQIGQTEFFNQYCDISFCTASYIGSIVMGFQYDNSDLNGGFLKNTVGCLTYNGTPGSNLENQPCDSDNFNQMFRISRFDAPLTTTGTPVPSLSGPYAQFMERTTGLCVVPATASESSPLTLGQCNPNNGIVWILVPPISAPGSDTVAPQQIVYTNNIVPIPKPNVVVQTLLATNAQSIYGFNQLGPGPHPVPGLPSLQPYTPDIKITSPDIVPYSTQILDKRIYPIMSGNYTIPNQLAQTPKQPSPILYQSTSGSLSTGINFPYFVWPPFTQT